MYGCEGNSNKTIASVSSTCLATQMNVILRQYVGENDSNLPCGRGTCSSKNMLYVTMSETKCWSFL